jgi:hypothetical protein
MNGATYEEAEAAKELLAAEVANLPELRGIGIAVLDAGYGVRLNLSGPIDRTVPTEINGVPVIVRIIGTIRPQ